VDVVGISAFRSLLVMKVMMVKLVWWLQGLLLMLLIQSICCQLIIWVTHLCGWLFKRRWLVLPYSWDHLVQCTSLWINLWSPKIIELISLIHSFLNALPLVWIRHIMMSLYCTKLPLLSRMRIIKRLISDLSSKWTINDIFNRFNWWQIILRNYSLNIIHSYIDLFIKCIRLRNDIIDSLSSFTEAILSKLILEHHLGGPTFISLLGWFH